MWSRCFPALPPEGTRKTQHNRSLPTHCLHWVGVTLALTFYEFLVGHCWRHGLPVTSFLVRLWCVGGDGDVGFCCGGEAEKCCFFFSFFRVLASYILFWSIIYFFFQIFFIFTKVIYIFLFTSAWNFVVIYFVSLYFFMFCLKFIPTLFYFIIFFFFMVLLASLLYANMAFSTVFFSAWMMVKLSNCSLIKLFCLNMLGVEELVRK